MLDKTYVDPYADRGSINGVPVPKKTEKEINADLAFNAREQELRKIRDQLRDERIVRNTQRVIIGDAPRPITPPARLTTQTQMEWKTPQGPAQLELQTQDLHNRIEGYFYRGEELSPSTYQLWKYQSKGALASSYMYETTATQLNTVLKRNQKKAAYPKDRGRVSFIGMITTEQAGEKEEAKRAEEQRREAKQRQREISRQIKEDQAILDRQWRKDDKKKKEEEIAQKKRINQEVAEGNKRLWEIEWERRDAEVEENHKKRQAERKANKSAKRRKIGK